MERIGNLCGRGERIWRGLGWLVLLLSVVFFFAFVPLPIAFAVWAWAWVARQLSGTTASVS